jgi:superfamily II DNA/RNA helicase
MCKATSPRSRETQFAMQQEATQYCRKKDFQELQNWYRQYKILPGKTQEEENDVETELFAYDPGQGIGTDFDIYSEVPCDLQGSKVENIPPMDSFDDIHRLFPERMPSELNENLRRCGYHRPTPVQRYAIPVAMAGRDVMCCAQTGSGKTAAFLVPMLASMIKNHRATSSLDTPFSGFCQPDTLILSPTRELCIQIYKETLKFCHKTPFRAVQVYGQESVMKQMTEIAKGADVVIATPGRLWDFVNSGILQVTETNCLVIDEADKMIDPNTNWYLREVVENSGMPQKKYRQTMMFSATLPDEIQRLAADYLFDHIWIGIGAVGGVSCCIRQRVMRVDAKCKFVTIKSEIEKFLAERKDAEKMIVFCNSIQQATALDGNLWDANIDSGGLHGGLSQKEREENLLKFRKGEIYVLVATNLGSRGLDIGNVTHVLNYDFPMEIDIYVQRIGRTGRIGHIGNAISFISVGPDGQYLDNPGILKELVLKMKDIEVPEWLTQHLQNQHLRVQNQKLLNWLTPVVAGAGAASGMPAQQIFYT